MFNTIYRQQFLPWMVLCVLLILGHDHGPLKVIFWVEYQVFRIHANILWLPFYTLGNVYLTIETSHFLVGRGEHSEDMLNFKFWSLSWWFVVYSGWCSYGLGLHMLYYIFNTIDTGWYIQDTRYKFYGFDINLFTMITM